MNVLHRPSWVLMLLSLESQLHPFLHDWWHSHGGSPLPLFWGQLQPWDPEMCRVVKILNRPMHTSAAEVGPSEVLPLRISSYAVIRCFFCRLFYAFPFPFSWAECLRFISVTLRVKNGPSLVSKLHTSISQWRKNVMGLMEKTCVSELHPDMQQIQS